MRQACAFTEGVERKLLDKRDSICLDVVALGPKLDSLDLLSSHYRANIRLADAHDTVGYALSCTSSA